MIVFPLVPEQTEPIVIEFARPAPLMNMNDRSHWRTYARNAKKWRDAAATAARDAGHGQLRPSIITVELPVLGNLRRDPHNLFPTIKHAIDGCVDAGLFPDDTPEWVTTTEPRLRPCTRAELAVTPVRIHIVRRTTASSL